MYQDLATGRFLNGNWKGNFITDSDLTDKEARQEDFGTVLKNGASCSLLPSQFGDGCTTNLAGRSDGGATHAVGCAL